MLNSIKAFLIKRWSKEIASELTKTYTLRKPPSGCKNLAGLGGQHFTSHFILWSDLLLQSRDPEIKWYRPDDLVARETLFYEYFGPFESWCDQNCQGGYYLYSDRFGVTRIFTDSRDEVLYRLIFSKSMPTMDEIYEIIVDRALEK